MKIKKLYTQQGEKMVARIANNYEVVLDLESRSNRSGFKHEGSLYLYDTKNGKTYQADAKIQYYNRTWERFTFESLIYKLFARIQNKENKKRVGKISKTIIEKLNNHQYKIISL